jgi:response regulator RpfG family c-di-GMP phosphodiesterase
MPAPTKLKILFVDDEPHILEALSQIFDMMYEVYIANSGKEAIAFVNENPDVAIVVSDQRMPVMKGIDVLKAVKQLSPETIRILLTGFADADAILDSVNVGEVFRYIKKPWDTENLKSVIAMAAATFETRKKSTPKPAAPQTDVPVQPKPVKVQTDTPIQADALEQAVKQHTVEEKFINKFTEAHKGHEAFEKAFHGPSGKPKILVVDDEQGVLTALSQLLSDSYEVLTCKSADEAIALLKEDAFVTLLLTDQRMPKKTGTDLLIESRDFAPLVPKVLITAYTDVEDIIRLINEGQIFRYIQKPWNSDKLREIVAEAVELYRDQVKSKINDSSSAKPATEKPSSVPQSLSAQVTTLDALKALSKMANKKSE